jgi:hypothetical protein
MQLKDKENCGSHDSAMKVRYSQVWKIALRSYPFLMIIASNRLQKSLYLCLGMIQISLFAFKTHPYKSRWLFPENFYVAEIDHKRIQKTLPKVTDSPSLSIFLSTCSDTSSASGHAVFDAYLNAYNSHEDIVLSPE